MENLKHGEKSLTVQVKPDPEAEIISQVNGTVKVRTSDVSGEDSDNTGQSNTKPISITKVTKPIKTEKSKENSLSPRKRVPGSSKKPRASSDSPKGTDSSEESFCGFDGNSSSTKHEIEKNKNFNIFLENLKEEEFAGCSKKESFDVGGIETVASEEDMTVDTEHTSETESEQMDIDQSNKDKCSDKNKDSDVDVTETDSVKSDDSKMAKQASNENVEKTDTDITIEDVKVPIPDNSLLGAKVEYCGSCDAQVDDAEDGICCDGACERWFHLRCSGLSRAEYEELSNDMNANWACPKCSGKPSLPATPVASGIKPVITVRKDLTETPSTPSPAATKRKSTGREGKTPKIDVSNPAFLKPFDYGWKRELVFRSTNESTPNAKRQGDIYYYTPKGKKLRSLREISDHVVGTELTLDNFTFFKEPLGLDPGKEIIRDAKFKFVNKDTNAASGTPKSVTPKVKVTPKLTATVTPLDSSGSSATTTPKASASVTPRVVIKKTSFGQGGLKVKIAPTKSVAGAAAQKSLVKKRNLTSDDELEMGMLPPMWEPVQKPKDAKTGSRLAVCSISCIPAMGTIPTLRCTTCLCLYHPVCVGLDDADDRPIDNYKCKNCQNTPMEKPKSTTGTISKPRLSPPPLTPITTISPSTSSIIQTFPAPPKLQRISETRPGFSPRNRISLPKSTSIVGGVTTWLPPSSQVHLRGSTPTTKFSPSQRPMPSNNSIVDSSSQPVQTIITIDTKRYVVVPKHNVLSVSPPATSVMTVSDPIGTQITTLASDPNTALATHALSPILTKPQSSQTPTFIVSSTANTVNSFQNPPGVLLVPYMPPQTSPTQKEGGPQPQYFVVNGPSGLQPGNFIIGNIPQQQPLKLPTVPTTQATVPSQQAESSKRPLESPEKEAPAVKKVKTESSPVAEKEKVVAPAAPVNYLQNFNYMYTALLQAFQYLKVQELLRASQVCHLWRDVALHRDLWITVRMKNSQVKDWEGFAATLRKVGTRNLDLRKILMPDKPEALKAMLANCAKALGKVNSLIKLDLCRCTFSFLESIVANCPQLEYISACALTKSGLINLSSLGKCLNLTELRLKSQGGMELINIETLEHLSKLKHLSLTTVKNMNEVLTVVGRMPQLESLELGDLTNTTEMGVKNFANLKKLKRLRLEKGQQDCPTDKILHTISQLPYLNQLELINFDIKVGFEEALGRCSYIKRLLIIPTYVTQSATTNHLVMEGVSKLSKSLNHFVWGLTTELLRVTDLFIDQWESQKNQEAKGAPTTTQKKTTNDSIPILKPSTGKDKKDGAVMQVDVLQLPKLHKVLLTLLPNTKIIILKVPFCHTWRQTISGSTS